MKYPSMFSGIGGFELGIGTANMVASLNAVTTNVVSYVIDQMFRNI